MKLIGEEGLVGIAEEGEVPEGKEELGERDGHPHQLRAELI